MLEKVCQGRVLRWLIRRFQEGVGNVFNSELVVFRRVFEEVEVYVQCWSFLRCLLRRLG